MILFVKRRQNSYSCCFVHTVAILLLTTVSRGRCLSDARFAKSSICDVDARVSNGCSSKQGNHVRGIISCTIKCSRDKDCMGASLDGNGDCFLHNECLNIPKGCRFPAHDHHYVYRRCRNRGVWVTSRCECPALWIGPDCEDKIYPTKCSDLIEAGYKVGTVRTKIDIRGDGSYLIPATVKIHYGQQCYLIAMVNAGQQNFSKTWSEYREGFYIDDSHLWIGLDHMHSLNQARQFSSFKIVVMFKDRSKTFSRHSAFNLSGDTNGFFFTHSNSFGRGRDTSTHRYDLENCLSGLQNKPFSTWDKDMDGDENGNCAKNYGSGWWYAGCDSPCNLLGWSVEHRGSKPPSTIMRVGGVDLEAVGDDLDSIQLQLE